MKNKLLNISVLTFLLVVASRPCFADMLIEDVSKERAKELGIEMRATANGPKEAWIELEFKPKGELKEFDHVSLEISDGEKFLLGYTPLKEERSSSGDIVVRLMANRAFLEKVTLSVVVGHIMNYSGYELRVKDFVDLKNLSDKQPKKPAPANTRTNAESRGLPASPTP